MSHANRSKILLLLIGLLLSLAVGACGGNGDEEALDEVVFLAGFKPQANLPFVAAYVAQEKGFFTEQGLEVEIRHAVSGGSTRQLVAGQADFTTADAGSVLRRISDPGLPIVAFVLFGQRGQQGFIALQDSGINTPKDWEGRTFGYKTSQPPEYLAILNANDVDRSRIQEARVGFDPRVLTEGTVDILAVFKSNEPDVVRRLGFEVNLWDPADYELPTMGLTYVTTNELAQENPDIVERFLKATLKGLEFAFNNKEEALDIVMKYAPDEDRDHQRFMLDTEMTDAVSTLTEERGLGWMTDAQWQGLYEQFLEFEALPNPFDYRTAFTLQFLQAVHGD